MNDSTLNNSNRLPKWVLTRFLEYWAKKDFKEMLKYCQVTWVKKSKAKNAEKALKGLFGKSELVGYEITGQKKIPEGLINLLAKHGFKKNIIKSTFLDIETIVHVKEYIPKTRTKTIRFRLVCEKGISQPSLNGKWGVNPLSYIYGERVADES